MAMMPRKEPASGVEAEDSIFTVKELLSIPPMSEASLAAGDSGFFRAITRVNVMEDLDVVPWVRPGELLLANGALFREDPERLARLLPELTQRGVAVLAIKPLGTGEPLPREAIAKADQLGLPLVALHPDTPLPEVAKAVMERVIALETYQLADLQNRIQSMTRLLLDGAGLYTFLDAMEEMLGNPVIVVREQDKPWMSGSLRSADPSDIWSLLQSLSYRQLEPGATSGFALLQGAHRVYVSPIPTRRMKRACLVLLERGQDIAPLDALSVDRLASLVGLEMANVEAVREVEGKYLDQFLQDWLSGKIVSDADWKLRADVCGCNVPEGSRLCVAIVGWHQKEPSPEKLREATRRLRAERLRASDGLLAAPLGNDLALVLPVGQATPAEGNASEALEQLLGKLLAELRATLVDREMRLYAGRIVDRYDGVHASWSQARRARQVAEVCGLPGEVVAYERLGVYSLLYLIPSGEERDQFLSRFTMPLQQADRKGGGRLVETLEMFFRCNGNIKLTSEKLYAHYNTIVYRLEKIQSILGVSLDDPEDRLQLHLALKLGQITPGSNG